MSEIALIVNGRKYSGWKSQRVTLSIESLCGSFALDVSDRWSDMAEPWPIAEEDACKVQIDGTTVIDGFVTKRSISATATSRALSYTGKDRAHALVKCSLLVPAAGTAGHKWSYRNVDIAQFAAEIAKPHGIKVSVQPGLELKKDPLLVAHPGETGFEAIKRAAASAGVLVVSDGAGGIVITRSGATAATHLIEGFNIESASADFDSEDRFHTYYVSSQAPGTDETNGEALRVLGKATDDDVRLTSHTLLIRPDKGYSAADAKRRADWEARNRAARATTVTIGVLGWRQPNGTLWPINALTTVNAPRLVGVDGQMLISQVEYTINEQGEATQLRLVRPDAFEPEPQTAVTSGEGAWLIAVGGELQEPGAKKK